MRRRILVPSKLASVVLLTGRVLQSNKFSSPRVQGYVIFHINIFHLLSCYAESIMRGRDTYQMPSATSGLTLASTSCSRAARKT